MQPDHINPSVNPDNSNFPPADYGNASNPSPHNHDLEPHSNQLLDKRAEKYLREVASPEDYPDAEDEQEMEETIAEAKEESKPE